MMRSSKFAPLSAPVYNPKPMTDGQYASGKAASAFLASHGYSPVNGDAVTPRTKARRPRMARVLKDTSTLTLDI